MKLLSASQTTVDRLVPKAASLKKDFFSLTPGFYYTFGKYFSCTHEFYKFEYILERSEFNPAKFILFSPKVIKLAVLYSYSNSCRLVKLPPTASYLKPQVCLNTIIRFNPSVICDVLDSVSGPCHMSQTGLPCFKMKNFFSHFKRWLSQT